MRNKKLKDEIKKVRDLIVVVRTDPEIFMAAAMKNKEYLTEGWQQTYMGNLVLTRDSFYVSYNKYAPVSKNGILGCAEETAFIIRYGEIYLVLNGDFRKEFEACNTIEDGIAVFEKNSEHKSENSDKVCKDKKIE